MSIADNLEKIGENIRRAAERSGRKTDALTLVAVSKTVEPERILEAYRLGLRDFGENYVQEASGKAAQLPWDINWHFIGHLQKNKVKQILPWVHLLHSADSLELLRVVERKAPSGKIPCLLEVNLAGEESKSGLPEEQVFPLLESAQDLTKVEIQGLMCIPPLVNRAEDNRPYFKRLRELLERINKAGYPHFRGIHLSMGMSDDYETAVEEGATMLRIGRALFGERSR